MKKFERNPLKINPKNPIDVTKIKNLMNNFCPGRFYVLFVGEVQKDENGQDGIKTEFLSNLNHLPTALKVAQESINHMTAGNVNIKSGFVEGVKTDGGQ